MWEVCLGLSWHEIIYSDDLESFIKVGIKAGYETRFKCLRVKPEFRAVKGGDPSEDKQLPEEKAIARIVEEAAEDLWTGKALTISGYPTEKHLFIAAFIAGARWMEEQLKAKQ